MQEAERYPVALEVDYPERQSRWKTLLRLFLAVPVFFFAVLISYAQFAVAWATWIAIFLRGSIPRWMFDSQVALTRWQVRAFSYFALLADAYPPFDGDYPVRFEAEYPERLSRWKTLVWKAVTSLPHWFVLQFLWIGAFISVVIGWFAILIAGRFPKGLHGFVAGVMRWQTRAQSYFFSLTDEYPPFSLSPQAGAAGRDTYVVSAVIGWLLAGGLTALFVAGAILGRETVRVDVSYDDLTAGRVSTSETTVEVWDVFVALTDAMDPADDLVPLLAAGEDRRLVAFRLEIANEGGNRVAVRESSFRLKDSEGDWHDPELVVVGGRVAPVKVDEGDTAETSVIFEIDDDAAPAEFHYRPAFAEGKRIVYDFE